MSKNRVYSQMCWRAVENENRFFLNKWKVNIFPLLQKKPCLILYFLWKHVEIGFIRLPLSFDSFSEQRAAYFWAMPIFIRYIVLPRFTNCIPYWQYGTVHVYYVVFPMLVVCNAFTYAVMYQYLEKLFLFLFLLRWLWNGILFWA